MKHYPKYAKYHPNQVIKFGGNKTPYIITNVKPDYFDAIRLTQGGRAAWQPISIRVYPRANDTFKVENLNNKKVVVKHGINVRKATENEKKRYAISLIKYANMDPLPSWTTDTKFLGKFRL